MLELLHNVDSGIKRLLAAPRDLPWGTREAERVPRSEASSQHRRLFDAYRAELTGAVDEAETWWTGMLAKAEEHGAHGPEATQAVYERMPAGPTSHPAVVGVVRKYWLACDALNTRHAPPVRPEVFLIAWPVECGMEREVVVLTGMPYWPIGVDATGRWV